MKKTKILLTLTIIHLATIANVDVFATSMVYATTTNTTKQFTLILPPNILKKIGKKIWQNECGGKISELTHWNQGENFISLGIGHFIWYPTKIQKNYHESFPELIQYMVRNQNWTQYMKQHHITAPEWLDNKNIPPCPWQSKEEFQQAIKNNDLKLKDLRNFLLNTIPIQTQYLIYRLENSLEQILKISPIEEQDNIRHKVNQLLQTSEGTYALIDYVNFKGDGIHENILPEYQKSKNNCKSFDGWGLRQALREMRNFPYDYPPIMAFSLAAIKTLERRVECAPLHKKSFEEKWLIGWKKRVNAYNPKT